MFVDVPKSPQTYMSNYIALFKWRVMKYTKG